MELLNVDTQDSLNMGIGAWVQLIGIMARINHIIVHIKKGILLENLYFSTEI